MCIRDRITSVSAGIFMLTSLTLAYQASRSGSEIERTAPVPAPFPAPGAPDAGAPAPGAPAAPAPGLPRSPSAPAPAAPAPAAPQAPAK